MNSIESILDMIATEAIEVGACDDLNELDQLIKEDEMGKSIEERIKDILVDQVGCQLKEITDSSTFEELGADSLDQIEIVMGFEEEFGIDIPDEQMESIKTVKDAVDYITGRLG